MKIDDSKFKGYLIHETKCGYQLCRVLNEYGKDQQAEVIADLSAVVTKKKKEKDILKEYSKKKVF